MRTEKNNLKFILFIILALTIFGCNTLEKKNQREEALRTKEKRIKNYASLREDLRNQKIETGTALEQIKSRYGEPEDVFESSSQISQFQVLTYEHPDESKKGISPAVRLYFNNGKLVYWTN